MKVVVSGLGQGDNPASGLGVARSLRRAFPEARLVGQDYSARAAALHDPVFDDVVVHRPWSEFDSAALKFQVESYLDDDFLFLSTIDLESYWLSVHLAGHPGVLSPPFPVFESVAKPLYHVPALHDLGIPESIALSRHPREVHTFFRRYGWRSWIKGPFHEAVRVRSWEHYQVALAQITEHWEFGGVHAQRHVDGTHEAIAFAALRGVLLDCVWIAKNDMTREGKTVAGSPVRPSPSDRAALAAYVSTLKWTGGGEIELIRDDEGKPWIIEVNPRFPAWIDGASLLGINLPAALIFGATGEVFESATPASGFVRVQQEIPVRHGFDPMPSLVLRVDEPLDASKAATSTRELAEHLRRTVGLPGLDTFLAVDELPIESVKRALYADVSPAPETPHWHTLWSAFDETLKRLSAYRPPVGQHGPDIAVAYSVKTNPDPQLMRRAAQAGFWAEVIGREEWDLALATGFTPDRIVVNGPVKHGLLHDAPEKGYSLHFADSVEELRAIVVNAGAGAVIGIRVKPPGIASRFGVPLEEPRIVAELFEILALLRNARGLALHFHIAHSVVGRNVWHGIADSLVELGVQLSAASGVPTLALDLGGGFYPEDLEDELAWLRDVYSPRARAALPELGLLIVEPGRGILQPAVALETSVCEVRDLPGGRRIIVDASIAELPEAGHFPHRVLRGTRAGWRELAMPGTDQVLGRTCMEADVLTRSIDARACEVGDRLLYLDAGGYDRSMAYAFGTGRLL